MKKSELMKAISQQLTHLPEADIAHGLNLIFEMMQKHVAIKKGRIEIRGFGVFYLREKKERIARNPRTGEKMVIQQKDILRFKPGKELRNRVNAG